MIARLRTNALVLISLLEAILSERGIAYLVADQHMSVIEGSTGFMRRRVLVLDAERALARRLLEEAGLRDELADR